MKRCTGCGLTKDFSEFHKRGNSYKEKCKSCRKIERHVRYENNKDIELIQTKAYVNTHKEQRRKYANQYFKDKRQNDIGFRVAFNMRTRIANALSGKTKKSARTEELLGCTFADMKLHIEKQFKPEMNWSNYGSYWEIDHIKPCASFDLTDPIQQKECFHYTNLQPLTVFDNISKNDNWARNIKAHT